MKRSLFIVVFIFFIFPISALGADPFEPSSPSAISDQNLNKLNDSELIKITGQGINAPHPEEIGKGTPRIRIWDEANAKESLNSYNACNGVGNKLVNSLSATVK